MMGKDEIMYDLLSIAWLVMAVIADHIGRKKDINFYIDIGIYNRWHSVHIKK